MQDKLIQLLKTYIIGALIKNDNIFDGLVTLMQTNWDKAATTMTEIRESKNTKAKGDLFEHFAYLYFLHCYNPLNIWLLKDVPDDVLKKLSLDRGDFGIDLILELQKSQYAAVQVKFRKPNKYKRKIVLGWKQLSTFYALVERTGPYCRHIIFTNANSCNYKGTKSAIDKAICIGTLRNISKEKWTKMSGMIGYTMEKTEKPSSLEELRNKRLKFYEKN